MNGIRISEVVVHFVDQEICYMEDGGFQREIFCLGRSMVIAHGFDQTGRKTPFLEDQRADPGVTEAKNFFFCLALRDSFGLAPDQNFFGFFGITLVNDQGADVVQHSGRIKRFQVSRSEALGNRPGRQTAGNIMFPEGLDVKQL